MSAPTLPTATTDKTYTATSSIVATIASGLTAGNFVVVLFSQEQSTIRTVSSVVDSAGNTYSLVISKTTGTAGSGADYIYAATIGSSLGAGGTVTITLNANSTGNVRVQEVSPCTNPNNTDTGEDAISTTSHISGTTGITSLGNVIAFAVCTSGSSSMGTLTATGVWTKLGGVVTNTMFMYVTQAGILAADQGTFTSSTSRVGRGIMAAFYDNSTPPDGQPFNSRLAAIPFMGRNRISGGRY